MFDFAQVMKGWRRWFPTVIDNSGGIPVLLQIIMIVARVKKLTRLCQFMR